MTLEKGKCDNFVAYLSVGRGSGSYFHEGDSSLGPKHLPRMSFHMIAENNSANNRPQDDYIEVMGLSELSDSNRISLVVFFLIWTTMHSW